MDESLEKLLDAGLKLCQANRFAEAEQLYRGGALNFPNHAPLLSNLAVVLAIQGKLAEAATWHDRAIAADANYLAGHLNRAKTLQSLKQFDTAIESLQQALHIDANNLDVLSELGACFRSTRRDAEAAECFGRVLAREPDRSFARASYGQTLWNLARQDESLVHLRRAVELEPQNAEYHLAYGLALLLQGHLREGFREAEYRWQTPEFRGMLATLNSPVWDGSPLNGRTIFLQPEQGMGDTLHFIRYAPMVAALGGRVIAGTHAPLKPIIASVEGVFLAVATGEPMPPHDCWIPLMSLPRIFQTELGKIPAKFPYVHAPADRVARWKEKLKTSPGLRIGLAWAGNPTHSRDHMRSMQLEQFAPLANVENVSFFSLQKGAGAEQLPSSPFSIIDLGSQLNDFADTAAVMENLDLIISVDTSIVHLAGALGKECWTLVHASPDWRWMLHREDSPWYPTMKLFRQGTLGDWNEVMQRVARELTTKAQPNETAIQLCREGRFAEAIEKYSQVLKVQPDHLDALSAIGVCQRQLQDYAAAERTFRQVVQRDPDRAFDQAYLGQSLRDLARDEEALPHLRRAVELEPTNAQYHLTLGMTLLQLGQFDEGWREFDYRWQTGELRAPNVGVPLWDGSNLDGKSIYLHPEQGFGDTIQFIRFAKSLADQGANVIAGSFPALASVLRSVDGVKQVICPGETLPQLDCWIPLMSIPRFLKEVPSHVPYVHADPPRVARWRDRLADTRGLRVGIVWAGSSTHQRDHFRSMQLKDFAPLAEIKNATFFSLQVGERAEQAKFLIDLAPHLTDFSETAAAIECIDLVIGVDTAVVHLAGALGKECWTLLHAAAEWRWLKDREDSPWYPTMKLFRQRNPGDWNEVMQRVVKELQSRSMSVAPH